MPRLNRLIMQAGDKRKNVTEGESGVEAPTHESKSSEALNGAKKSRKSEEKEESREDSVGGQLEDSGTLRKATLRLEHDTLVQSISLLGEHASLQP